MPAFDIFTDLYANLRSILQGPEIEGLMRVLLAGLLGALVGLEREMEGKPAGIRTYGSVAMGSAIFTVVGIQAFGPGDAASRVAAQIVTGIGFIGAGTILHMQHKILGLTTAAGLWVAAAVGMAIGGGLYVLGIGAAIVLFLLLRFLRPEWLVRWGLASQEDVEGRVEPKRSETKASDATPKDQDN